jgi:geranylgeranyl transferase type-2 subunit alpha
VDAEEQANKNHLLNLLSEFSNAPLESQSGRSILDISKDILYINPEFYPAWNRRKDYLLKLNHLADRFADELEFSFETLKLNPKSYQAWYHRRWLLSQMKSNPDIIKSVAPTELKLCGKLFDVDCRNFHAWNYRNFIVDELLGRDIEDEIRYTRELINKNFSNYSAWHRRAYLLSKLSPSKRISSFYNYFG